MPAGASRTTAGELPETGTTGRRTRVAGKPAARNRSRGAAGVKDVAAAAGVSLGTVSNVLNRPEMVSPATRAKVEAAMESLGFVRNESARQLRAGSSRIVAYLMLDAGNPFFTDVARGVEEAAREAGLSVFLCNSNEDAGREADYLDLLEQQRVQGVLITPIDPHSSRIATLPLRGTPVVVVDRSLDDAQHCSVAVDDVLGGEVALTHLIELGHERVAFVGGPNTIGQVTDRREGARNALEEAGLPAENLVELTTAALTVAEGRGAGQRLAGLPADRRPTAAFCANDLLALGLLQQCVSLGLRVPEDLAIVGYDDIEFAAAAAVPLTSVRQPRQLLGKTAAELLLDESSNPDHEHQRVTFTPELVVRTSTRGKTSR
ncbi:transcriptional regulator, LacI family [Kribbella flavida DSM 17836]|uniref:Transcriptional regulator, LacI family n=1 Tax=Kribbella flavida (strain DSM 17836 / JCM 10339 / NBRC 14399) TaxID=479435 RepID=D2PT63_KRIFD|nr:LacI family DNA-binding transcriptional regulator [Kribbella flavida]ADB29379.1 transcriptional regulator, LacI family [Kribbella flavida DSM 17836]